MKWRCALFDLDGTLVDSEALNCRAYPELIPEITDDLETLIHHYRGQKFKDTLRDIEHRYGVKLPNNFETTYRAHLNKLFTSELKPIAGVETLLKSLQSQGISCCVASNAPQNKIRLALAVTGLNGYFGENLFSAYDIKAWKPKPDLFLYAAKQMGYSIEQCVVFEDSTPGVEAAFAAGMHVFHYQPEQTPENRKGYSRVATMMDMTI